MRNVKRSALYQASLKKCGGGWDYRMNDEASIKSENLSRVSLIRKLNLLNK